MKNNGVRFISGLLSVIVTFSLIVAALDSSGGFAAAIGSAAAAVLSPADTVRGVREKMDAYISENGGQTTTASPRAEDAQETMNRIGSKDSEDDSSITSTPEDIAELMAEEEKTFKSQKKIGDTSEEPYFGGGTLVEYDGVEVQSKIPSSFYKLDIQSLLKDGVDLALRKTDEPTILVYHSHTTESYTLLDAGYYTASLDVRSSDIARNMVRVGDELVAYLEKAGFHVVHDRTIHDKSYNAAYDSSRKAIQKYLEQYPTIQVTIDVHRDSITYDNKTKVKPTAEVNGKKAAKMMIIAGCEYGDVEDFPNWEDNLRFDLAVQKKLYETYPGLMRPILFSERKYNMNMTKYSFLLEVGTDANTLDEACYSARLFGKALGELLKEEYME